MAGDGPAPEPQEAEDAAQDDASASKPAWRKALEKAMKSNKSQIWSKWFQLATVRPDGSPANRTVVFRGFVPGSNDLYIVTDSRSKKIGEIAQNPWAEIAWYFTISREQFRIRGKLRVVGPSAAQEAERSEEVKLRVAAWQGMSDAARNGFAWPEPGAAPPAAAEAFASASASPVEPPDTFSIVCMEPTHIDHLILKGMPQRRTQHTCNTCSADRSWLSTPCNP
eukprot:Tamp_25019.p1 GENE.Tamp_25019~~Tamp_25019.p1  ORF type:complete len:247 (+),score=38.86 Tamp_25019:70-741(+)